jgi:hypothetical protein
LEHQQEALSLILDLPDPPEDDGAEAQANFHFQCEVIARWCYGLLQPDGPTAVVCEHHEDFLVVYDNGQVDLASVKHRGINRGTWSIAELCDDGGLTHLFDRWLAVSASGRPIRVMHVSNAGLTKGPGQSLELARLCESSQPDPQPLLTWAKKLTRQFLSVAKHKRMPSIPSREPPTRAEQLDDTDPLVKLCAVFITRMSFVAVPHRDDIAAGTIIDVAMPLLQTKGWHGTQEAHTYHNGVVTLVEKTVKTFGKRRLDLARQVVDLALWPIGIEREQRLAARLLDARVLETVTVTGTDIPLYPPGESPLPAPGGAVLRRKMITASLPAISHHLAERWRSAWYTTRRSRLPDLPGDAALVTQLETEVLELVLDAQDDITTAGTTPYGPAFFRHLREKIRISAFRQRPPLNISDQHALGIAFDLSEQCAFDFLPPHDTNTTADADHA